MKPRLPAVVGLAFSLAALLACGEVLAVGRTAEVDVVDRATGATLPVHRHRGEYWVEGRPGARYSIRIRNVQGHRLLAVTSIDGVNVVTGETASADQRGYVFDGWAGYDITGWRKSDAQVAAFEFTSVPRSYAARTGRPTDVGIIGVALFRERMQVAQESNRLDAPAPVASPPLLAQSEPAVPMAAEKSAGAAADSRSLSAPRAPTLGTGHGRREDSRVTQVGFERARPTPDEVILLRYDSRANLVAMGIVRENPTPRRPDAFPGDTRLGYVPDP